MLKNRKAPWDVIMAEEEVFVEEKAAIVDPGHRLKRIGGIPSPLFGSSTTILVAGVGRYLDYRGRTAAKCIAKSEI